MKIKKYEHRLFYSLERRCRFMCEDGLPYMVFREPFLWDYNTIIELSVMEWVKP